MKHDMYITKIWYTSKATKCAKFDSTRGKLGSSTTSFDVRKAHDRYIPSCCRSIIYVCTTSPVISNK